jgi:hypothetical protein
MSEMGLGCVKTRGHSIAIEEIVRPRPFLPSGADIVSLPRHVRLVPRADMRHAAAPGQGQL